MLDKVQIKHHVCIPVSEWPGQGWEGAEDRMGTRTAGEQILK